MELLPTVRIPVTLVLPSTRSVVDPVPTICVLVCGVVVPTPRRFVAVSRNNNPLL